MMIYALARLLLLVAALSVSAGIAKPPPSRAHATSSLSDECAQLLHCFSASQQLRMPNVPFWLEGTSLLAQRNASVRVQHDLLRREGGTEAELASSTLSRIEIGSVSSSFDAVLNAWSSAAIEELQEKLPVCAGVDGKRRVRLYATVFDPRGKSDETFWLAPENVTGSVHSDDVHNSGINHYPDLNGTHAHNLRIWLCKPNGPCSHLREKGFGRHEGGACHLRLYLYVNSGKTTIRHDGRQQGGVTIRREKVLPTRQCMLETTTEPILTKCPRDALALLSASHVNYEDSTDVKEEKSQVNDDDVVASLLREDKKEKEEAKGKSQTVRNERMLTPTAKVRRPPPPPPPSKPKPKVVTSSKTKSSVSKSKSSAVKAAVAEAVPPTEAIDASDEEERWASPSRAADDEFDETESSDQVAVAAAFLKSASRAKGSTEYDVRAVPSEPTEPTIHDLVWDALQEASGYLDTLTPNVRGYMAELHWLHVLLFLAPTLFVLYLFMQVCTLNSAAVPPESQRRLVARTGIDDYERDDLMEAYSAIPMSNQDDLVGRRAMQTIGEAKESANAAVRRRRFEEERARRERIAAETEQQLRRRLEERQRRREAEQRRRQEEFQLLTEMIDDESSAVQPGVEMTYGDFDTLALNDGVVFPSTFKVK